MISCVMCASVDPGRTRGGGAPARGGGGARARDAARARCVTGSRRGGCSSGAARAAARFARRASRRAAAAAWAAAWAGVAGETGGISAAGPSADRPNETNVRYADTQWDRAPVRMHSSSTRTPTWGGEGGGVARRQRAHPWSPRPAPAPPPTSALDANTRLTVAATTATDPARAGRRKWTASTDAVTTGPRASVLAARPAATSIQDSTVPPKQMPSWSASAGTMSWWT